jgi:hypothetical protein
MNFNPFIPGHATSREFLRWVKGQREAGQNFASFEMRGRQYLAPLSHELIVEILGSPTVILGGNDPRPELAKEIAGIEGEVLAHLYEAAPFDAPDRSPRHHQLRKQYAHPVAGSGHIFERIKSLVRKEFLGLPSSSPFNFSHFTQLLCLKIGLDILGLTEGVNHEDLLSRIVAALGVAAVSTKEDMQKVGKAAIVLAEEATRILRCNPSSVFHHYQLSENQKVSFASFYFFLMVFDPSDLLDRASEHLLILPEEERQSIRDNPNALKGFINEVIRYYPVIGYLIRFANKDTVLRTGVFIPVGTRLMLIPSISAFDENQYPDPYTFDHRREVTGKPIVFGFPGAHACVGMDYTKDVVTASLQVMLEGGFTLTFTGTRELKDSSFFVGTKMLEAIITH